MKITFVLPFASLAGGVRVVAIYARLLAARGHEVCVVSQPQAMPPLSARLRAVLRGRGPRKPKPSTPLFEELGDRHKVLDRVRPVTAADVPDADAIVATWWATAPAVAALPRSKGIPFYLLQDYEVFAKDGADAVIASYRLPLHKIAVSGYIRQIVGTHVPDHEIDLVLNAVDTAHFRQPPRSKNAEPTVGFLYKDHPRKRVSLAIDAVSAARARVPGLKVVAFGAQLPRSGGAMPDWVEFRPNPPQAEIPNIYGASDAWLFTSQSEGFGLPLLEAMACGTPVLATRAGAAEDLIDGQNGRLLDPTPEAFAAAIAEIAAMPPDTWNAMSNAAVATAQRHTWEDATDALLAVLTARVAQG